MSTIAIPAHFDGKHIVLDEPIELPPNASLLVTLLSSPAEVDAEEGWLKGAASSDTFAFLADDGEDIYTLGMANLCPIRRIKNEIRRGAGPFPVRRPRRCQGQTCGVSDGRSGSASACRARVHHQ
jgi:hypothetical protein